MLKHGGIANASNEAIWILELASGLSRLALLSEREANLSCQCLEEAKQESSIAENRRAQVGRGDRSEKIRTYNYPQNRVTDHRIGLSLHKLELILGGDLDEMVGALKASTQPEMTGSA